MTRTLLAPLAAAVLVAAAPGLSAAGTLRAGAAKVDISPTKEMFPMHAVQTFAGVHDPLFARALVLDNGTSKVALIGVDTTELPNSEDIVRAVTKELGITADHLSLASTHDHNAPTLGIPQRAGSFNYKPYLDLLLKGIVQAAREANAKLQPARIGYGTGKAYVNTNRDEKIDGWYRMGYAPEGPTDKTVTVLSVTTESGEPIAVWSNYAVHGVVMFQAKTKDGMAEITGDIGGATSAYVEDRIKGAVDVWTPGAAGDQNPLLMSYYNEARPDAHDEGAAGYAILDVEARRLGEEIVRVAKGIENTTDRVVLWGKETSVSCPGQRPAVPPPPPPPGSGPAAPPPRPSRMVDSGTSIEIPLSLLMINDIALANVSGEVFSEIGLRLKKESLFDRTALVSMSPGRVGYIPSENAYLLPSQMAAYNAIKPGCAEQGIVNAFVGLEKEYLPVWTAAH